MRHEPVLFYKPTKTTSCSQHSICHCSVLVVQPCDVISRGVSHKSQLPKKIECSFDKSVGLGQNQIHMDCSTNPPESM